MWCIYWYIFYTSGLRDNHVEMHFFLMFFFQHGYLKDRCTYILQILRILLDICAEGPVYKIFNVGSSYYLIKCRNLVFNSFNPEYSWSHRMHIAIIVYEWYILSYIETIFEYSY